MAAPQGPFQFEVAFSFAGPHRDKVRAIAEIVSNAIDPDIKFQSEGHVFFDEWFEHLLNGDNADVTLQRTYHEQSRMVVMDLSEDYSDRSWCQAEASAIRSLRMSIDTARDQTARLRLAYIRFADGEAPGILNNLIHWDARKKTPQQLANLIVRRLAELRRQMTFATPLVSDAQVPASSFVLPPILFFHTATNDDRYSCREKELRWLDDCAKNPHIRIATITGQGGLGKTSLVGHWIEKHQGWQHRAFRGVFFYSFYSNRYPKAFFEAFLTFVCEVEKVRLPKEPPLHHLAAAACKKWSYLVVLDGLEVLQHGEEDPHYGWIADGELTEFVARVGAEGASQLILTSRFPFPRITDEHPAAARALELPLFTNAEGADLLGVCGLDAPRRKLERYSELLGGHPLALRIFAGACLEQPFDEPEKVSSDVRSAKGVEAMPDPDESGLSLEERQKRRQRRQFYKLLRWFQQKLSPPKRRLVQLVALFHDPVRTETLIELAQGVRAMKKEFRMCDSARITGLLDQLSGQFLLQKGPSPAGDAIHWTAHPIVREVFREAALASGDTVAKQFAQIVAGKGNGKHPKTVADVLPIVESIQVLLAAGDLKTADKLYRGRLENGEVFRSIPAPQEGLRCARSFLEPAERRAVLEKMLGRGRLASHLTFGSLCAIRLGEMTGVVQELEKVNELLYEREEWDQLSRGYLNISQAHVFSGGLLEAIANASEALFYAGVFRPSDKAREATFVSTPEGRATILLRPALPPYNDPQSVYSRGHLAHTLSLAGRLAAASQGFVEADATAWKSQVNWAADYALRRLWWACHRLHLGETEAARILMDTNRGICERNDRHDNLAQNDLILGELDLLAGNIAAAERRIAGALRIFREARQGQDLPDALLATARVRRAIQLAQKGGASVPASRLANSLAPPESPSAFTGDESALSHCEEALRLAARSGFLLKKCDSLNFRALLLCEAGQSEKALADAREAHDIAQRCDYYWGIHGALRQLRDTAKALNLTAEFREWEKAERDLTAKMKPEIEEALRINREHDAEMERLYGKKKKE